MPMRRRTREGALLTELLLSLSRARPLVEALGQEIAEPAGLTVAGWQVVSALGGEPTTVPELARRLGRRRQTVQVAVDDLVRCGYADKLDNPMHARSPLIALTAPGTAAFWDTVGRQIDAVNDMARTLSGEDLAAAVRVVGALTEMLTAEMLR